MPTSIAYEISCDKQMKDFKPGEYCIVEYTNKPYLCFISSDGTCSSLNGQHTWRAEAAIQNTLPARKFTGTITIT